MASLMHVATQGGNGYTITGLELFTVAGTAVLQSYSATGGLQESWLLGSGTAVPTGGYNPGDGYAITAVDLSFGGAGFSLTDDQLARIEQAGGLTVALNQSGFSGFRVESLWVERGSNDWLFAEAPSGGLYRFDISQADLDAGGTLAAASTATAVTGPLDDLAQISIGGSDFLVTVSAQTDAVDIWQIGSGGALTQTDSLPGGVGIDAPTAVVPVSVGGAEYLVVAAAGTGSLSVFGLSAAGGLTLTDHVLDDSVTTRFQGVTQLEIVEQDGRSYILASGSDQGLTVLTLLPGGRLVHLASIGDSTATSLSSISALTAASVNGSIQIFATSETEPGLTQLAFDPGPAGTTWVGNAAAQTASGGAANDILMGEGGDDSLSGGAGDDILCDGTGDDTLRGGDGDDLFILTADGTHDTILDFDPQHDRLDLSGFGMLYSLAQVQVVSTPQGAWLYFGDEEIEIFSAGGGALDVTDFSTATILDLDRPPQGNFTERLKMEGTPGADQLIGTQANVHLVGAAGDDILISLDGDNLLNGGSGEDCVDYSQAGLAINADLDLGLTVIGTGWQDYLVEIEHLIGSNFGDMLRGHAGGNILSGGAGADQMFGEGGNDELRGGTGADTLRGGADNDTLYGNSSTDVLYGEGGDDSLQGGDGVDLLFGGDDNDYLIGHKGWDELYGEAGNDELRGSSGADLLNGGAGDDELHGGTGVDTLNGGGDNDTLYGNQGADMMFGDAGADELFGGSGSDNLNGGDGNDTLWGNEGSDDMFGNGDDDELRGGTGDDNLRGGAGADTLFGNQGVDTLNGGDGDDWLRGGTLADTFVYAAGADWIDDFSTVEDNLQLDDALWTGTLTAQQVLDQFGSVSGGNYVLDFGGGNTLTFNGTINTADLVDDITFV